jgi:hypothetical protein
MTGKPHLVGWRIIGGNEEGKLSLVLVFYNEAQQPDIIPPTVIWSADETPENYPERLRVKIIADAICRYLNAGGSVDEARDVVDLVSKLTRGTTMKPPEKDYKLVAVEDDNVFAYVYADLRTPDKYVHIVQDEFSTELNNLELLDTPVGQY